MILLIMLLGCSLLWGMSSMIGWQLPMRTSSVPRTETYQYTYPVGPPEPLRPRKVLDVDTTGYWCDSGSSSKHCDSPAPNDGLTATGTTAKYGTCATDPTYIRLGTLLFVPGYGPCWATDTGSKIK